MIKFLKRAIEDIRRGENIDLYVTVLFAFVLAVLNVFGFADAHLLASTTLATLALLAVGLLVNRHRMEALADAHRASDAIIFSEEWPDLRPEFERAEDIYLVGINLSRTTINNYALFERKLNQGVRLRVLLMDPDGISTNIFPAQTYGPNTPEGARATIRKSIELWMHIARAARSPQHFELRVLDHVLPFGLILTDAQLPSGKIFVESYSYKMPLDDVPKFQLEGARSPYWYSHFRRQFDVLWSHARPWQEMEDSPSR